MVKISKFPHTIEEVYHAVSLAVHLLLMAQAVVFNDYIRSIVTLLWSNICPSWTDLD